MLLLLVEAIGRADGETKLVVVLGAFGVILAISTFYGWSIDRIWRRTHRSADLRASAFKDDFVVRISHQLRTHLTGIVGYAQLIEPRSADEVEAVSTVVSQSVELSELIDDLAIMARIDAGVITVEPQPVSVKDEAASAAGLLELLGTEVRIECSDAEVDVDPGLFGHVLRNLLLNAHRHGRPPVTVRGRASQGRYVLQVVDEGSGVSEEIKDELFGRFVRGRNSPGPLGLGLAVVKELAGRMDCEISYRHFRGETHFVLTLPLVRASTRNGGLPTLSSRLFDLRTHQSQSVDQEEVSGDGDTRSGAERETPATV